MMDIYSEESSKKMNGALLIPEILRLIIRHLHPVTDKSFENPSIALDEPSLIPLSKEVTQTLARVALVCTLFLDHALDYLWWFTNDLTPLFQLLPAFKPANNTVKVSLIDGDVLSTELQRFNSYACRIRGYHMRGKERFHPSTIARILRECDRRYLLPSLQCLLVGKSPIALLSFIPPSLQHLLVKGDAHRSNQDLEIYPNISCLPRVSPDLRQLALASKLTENSLTAITQLKRLENLSLDYRPVPDGTTLNFDPSLILQMSSANTLRELRLGEFIRFTPFASTSTSIFPALETLDITTGSPTIRMLNSFLRSVVLPQLDYIDILVPTVIRHLDNTDRKHWLEFFQILPKITSRKLTMLSFASAETLQKPTFWSSLNLSIKDIPDLGLLNITSFAVKIPLFSSISTSCLEHIASHWPNLTSLHLSADPKPILGLHALSYLAQSLLSLQELTMSLPSETYFAFTDFPVLNHGLRDLTLTQLNAPSPREVARVVDRLFPRLDQHQFYAISDDLQEHWDEVSELLEFLRSSRDDQMERQRNSDEIMG
ncbi:hypothetical protein CPB83DRAFT_886189 [Crepidotus variabilis]|uniref:F-box domain-containing protein n=1 Tax=Crepidotus variabilis TaxID=179855 RepID=A0A9P6E8Q9_9AGAR|nr:hypothetical protein CPB83DRAFT_886189 [Crepidotus variabilis]